jgi:hypothetical protein
MVTLMRASGCCWGSCCVPVVACMVRVSGLLMLVLVLVLS